MRLISLILALVIISGLVIYNKNALLPGQKDSHKTVKEQAHQIIDSAKNSAQALQEKLNQEQKHLDQSTE